MGDPYPGKIKYEGGKPVKLTYQEIVATLALAGWPEKEWATATAVAHYESVGGAVNVYNTYKEGHYGLFQISKSAHPAFFEGNKWWDPLANAKYALTLWRQSGYRPWEAYTNGRYASRLLQAKAAVLTVLNKRESWQRDHPGPIGPAFYQSLFRKGLLESMAMMGLGDATQWLGESLGAGAQKGADAAVEAGIAAAQAAQNQASAVTGAVQLFLGAGRWLSSVDNWIRVAQVVAGGALFIAGIGIVAKPITGVTPAGAVVKAAKGLRK